MKKKLIKENILALIIIILFPFFTSAQSVGINNDATAPHTSAMLDVKSTTKGLLIPRMNTFPANPADGLLIYREDVNLFYYFNGTLGVWEMLLTQSRWEKAGNYVYVTGDSVGVGTNSPLTKFHVLGSTTLSEIMLSPDEPFSGDDSRIVLTEDNDNTYHMNLTYDGGDNRLYVFGKNNATINGPHMGINRDNGRVGIGTGTTNPVSELEVVGTVTATAFDGGDASGLTNVFADSIRGSMLADSTDILQWNGNKWAPTGFGKYAFHASASTDQTIGNTAYDTLRCNNSSSGENFEYPAGIYDNSSYAFEAPVDGIYFFEAAALWDNVNTAEVRNAIFIRVNNTDEVGEWSASGGTDFFGTGVSTTLELNQGDEVRIRVYNGSNNSMDTFSQSGKYCYFSGYMVFAK